MISAFVFHAWPCFLHETSTREGRGDSGGFRGLGILQSLVEIRGFRIVEDPKRVDSGLFKRFLHYGA